MRRALLLFLIVLPGCGGLRRPPIDSTMTHQQKRPIDLQGHRGARGLLPENTLAAFEKALELRVNTLEMDAVISADRKVVVSHEPWMSGVICRKPDGTDIRLEEERLFNLFKLTYEEIARYDCGSRGNPRFPQQERLPSVKPLLKDVITMAESYAVKNDLPPPLYNVEIKSRAEDDGIYHPPPDEFARLLYDVLNAGGVLDRSTVQSFDPRALRATREIDPRVSLSLLVDSLRSFTRNIRSLGFYPQIYSPNFMLVSRNLVDTAHRMNVRVVPWTVNSPDDMRRLLEIGVDGIITDYPDVGRRIIDIYESERNRIERVD